MFSMSKNYPILVSKVVALHKLESIIITRSTNQKMPPIKEVVEFI